MRLKTSPHSRFNRSIDSGLDPLSTSTGTNPAEALLLMDFRHSTVSSSPFQLRMTTGMKLSGFEVSTWRMGMVLIVVPSPAVVAPIGSHEFAYCITSLGNRIAEHNVRRHSIDTDKQV